MRGGVSWTADAGQGVGRHTAINKAIDLLFGHAGTLGGTKGAFLLLAPFVDVMEVIGIAEWLARAGAGERSRQQAMDERTGE